jgi:hypothetical protein
LRHKREIKLIDVLRVDEALRLGDDVALCALAYRPTHRHGQDQVDA